MADQYINSSTLLERRKLSRQGLRTEKMPGESKSSPREIQNYLGFAKVPYQGRLNKRHVLRELVELIPAVPSGLRPGGRGSRH